MAKPLPDAAYLRECLEYDPETGVLVWKHRPRSHFPNDHIWRVWISNRAGERAGGLVLHGYRRICLNRQLLYEHRVIMAMQTGIWPVAEVDHLNRDRADNRWSNLRAATRPQNMRNRPKNAGLILPKGVFFTKSWRYRASAWFNGATVYLGVYDTPEAAHTVWREFMREHHGEVFVE